jgi:hypothetical protein
MGQEFVRTFSEQFEDPNVEKVEKEGSYVLYSDKVENSSQNTQAFQNHVASGLILLEFLVLIFIIDFGFREVIPNPDNLTVFITLWFVFLILSIKADCLGTFSCC